MTAKKHRHTLHILLAVDFIWEKNAVNRTRNQSPGDCKHYEFRNRGISSAVGTFLVGWVTHDVFLFK